MPYGLYVHIPYCRSRCRYCNFYTAGGSRGVPAAYIEALLRDFARYAPQNAAGRPLAPRTVYFGGGTPGLLAPAQVEELLAAFAPQQGAEITLETNPELAMPSQLASWRKVGVNRLSLGVQTAGGQSLRRMGRLHTAQDAKRALEDARQAGFDNISADMMLALPGYTYRELEDTLSLLQSGATHVSAYLLKIEQGTAFAKIPPGELPTGDEAADFYLYAARRLEQMGYIQYEISNFAKPGFAGRHNLFYWNCDDYLGLGPAAHSCLGGVRFSFDACTADFLADALPARPEGNCTAQDYIMLRLRLADGLEEAALQKRFGVQLSPQQQRLLQQYAAGKLAAYSQGIWRLTQQGMLVQNSILAQLLDED